MHLVKKWRLFVSVLPCWSEGSWRESRREGRAATGTRRSGRRRRGSIPTSASPSRRAGNESEEREQRVQGQGLRLRESHPSVSSAHRLPVVEGLVAVGDVAEQSGAEAGRHQALERRGALGSPDLARLTGGPERQRRDKGGDNFSISVSHPERRACSPARTSPGGCEWCESMDTLIGTPNSLFILM